MDEAPRVVMTEYSPSPLDPLRDRIAPHRGTIMIFLLGMVFALILFVFVTNGDKKAEANELSIAEIYAPLVTPMAPTPEPMAAPLPVYEQPRAPVAAEPAEPAPNVSPVNNMPRPELASLFPPNVSRWRDQIVDAAWEYGFDPNLLAIVVTVESCGNPQAVSRAGARGLAQVMPFHFAAGEDPFDPMTNLRRGANYFAAGLRSSGGDIGTTFAGYNGGHGRIQKGFGYWPAETRRYHELTMAIYADFINGQAQSPTVMARCPH